MRLKLMAAFAALLFSACAMALDRTNWNPDLEAAKAQAKKDGKDVFVFFSGTDWNGASDNIAKDLLDQKDFLDFAKKNYVLALIDFPEQKNMTPEKEATAKKSIDISKSFRNAAMPAIIIMKATGEAYVYLQGYEKMALADFISALEKQAGITKLMYDQEMALADKSVGLERAKHLNAALAGLVQLGVFMTGANFGHDKTINEIIALDKDNELHMKSDWVTYQALSGIDDAAKSRDWAKTHKLVDGILAQFPKELNIVQKMYAIKSYAYRQAGDAKNGLECLKKCAETDPESELGQQAAAAIEQLTPKEDKAQPLMEDNGK